ncbi:MAG: FAD-dependent oxidoreductase, partial [Okeania sp. SIO2D1]|nr:FAD-dependent oxidoreductase [Okeania sp. SIO2D1]
MSVQSTCPETFDVVIVGCGVSGSTLAFYLASAGISVLAIEKETFPRYHIGESLTGMVRPIIDDMGLAEEMDRRQFPVKGGVKVMGKEAKREFFVPVLHSTWQVKREEFDQILLERAIEAGAQHCQGTVKEVIREGDKVVGVKYQPREGDKTLKTVRGSIVVDATGQATLFANQGVAGQRINYDEFSKQVAVFAQFKNALRDPGEMGDNTFIFHAQRYHWSWFIPISPEIVSIGIVVPTAKVSECGGKEETLSWGLENINPDLQKRVKEAEYGEVRSIGNYSYSVDPFV